MPKKASQRRRKFTVGIVLYPDFDLLDVAGPYDVFTFFDGGTINRDVQVVTVGEHKAPIAAVGGLMVTPSHDFTTCPRIDLLFVPGAGSGITGTIGNDRFLEFLRRAAARSRYVTSVCTGALLLASARLLDGYRATTHWSCIDCLKLFEKVLVVNGCPRYVRDRNRFTGGGISSSVDESLFMIQSIVTDMTGDAARGAQAAQHIQLSIQYNPHPPFAGGDPCSVDYSVYAPVAAGMKPFRDAVALAVAKRIGIVTTVARGTLNRGTQAER
jgi:cyclohexyl-isocyanide hydratase